MPGLLRVGRQMDKLAVFRQYMPDMAPEEVVDRMVIIVNKVLRHPWKAVPDYKNVRADIVLVDPSIQLTPELRAERDKIVKAIIVEAGGYAGASGRTYE